MPRSSWEEKAAFMRDVGATEAEWGQSPWDVTDEVLLSLKLAPRVAPQQPAAQPGPAAKVAEAFANRMKRDHDVRFAATHFRPRIESPANAPQDDVPRAVRAREASRGRSPSKQPNR